MVKRSMSKVNKSCTDILIFTSGIDHELTQFDCGGLIGKNLQKAGAFLVFPKNVNGNK